MPEIQATSTGHVPDPRMRAVQGWLAAVQADLDATAREIAASNPPENRTGTGQKIVWEKIDPRNYPYGFAPGRRYGFTSQLGSLGTVRIG